MTRGKVSGSLAVLDATGCVGSAMVAAAVAVGRSVIAVARDPVALAALRECHAGHDVVTVTATLTSDDAAAALAAQLHDLGRPVSGAIAAICGDLERGRVLDAPADVLRRRLDEDLLPHLFAARHLLPLLAAASGHGHRGGYVLIGGPGADRPWAGYGHRSIAAAALRMLARVLHEEARAYPLRVQLLAIDSPLRTDDNARHACSAWPHVEAIARRAVRMAGGDAGRSDAIVRYPGRDAPAAIGDDDIDGDDHGIRDPTPDNTAQKTDSDTVATAQTSLHDARDLLRAIANAPRIQETSP
ncbi:MAG: SDR family NAD(P)-dependent oxidoreductase [Luteimonas sp.]